MSQDRFIFETVDFQDQAITINNYASTYNAQCNAAVTGNTFKYASDYDRMKSLIGTNGKPRTSGYYDGLYANLYALTVTQPTLPSSNGPGNSGWGRQLWSGPINPILINDTYLQTKGALADYVGAVIGGYLYSPVATTATFQTTADDGTVVFFNGTKVIDNWVYQGPTTTTSASQVVNVGYNPIQILYFEGGGSSVFTFSYRLGNGPFTGDLGCVFYYNYNQM